MEILRCTGLRRVYGTGEARVVALDGVDLALEQGEFVAVTGPSGSGKSTLLHLLGAVDRPTAGTISVCGQDISALNPTRAAIFRRRNVGIVYQFHNLLPTLTVRRNLLLPLLLDHREPDKAFFTEIVSTLGLEEKLDAWPHQLSGGQQQRAAIARGLLPRPALLLADEPTGSLDRKAAREVTDLLQQASRRFGQTVLMITHDETLALEADRVITLEDGRVTGDRRRP